MVTVLQKADERTHCMHCGVDVEWVWVMKYESPQFQRLVRLCSRCEHVIRIDHVPDFNGRKPSPVAA